MEANNIKYDPIKTFIVLHSLNDQEFLQDFRRKVKPLGIKKLPQNMTNFYLTNSTLVLFGKFSLDKLNQIDFRNLKGDISPDPKLYLAVTKLKLDVDLIHFNTENIINEYKSKPYTDKYTLLGFGIIYNKGNPISIDPNETIYSLASKFSKVKVLRVY